MNYKDLLKNTIGVTTIKFIKSWFRSTDDKLLTEQRRTFYRQFLQPGGVLFDIGANYGNRIEPLINDGLKIIAVEPQLECVRFLRKKYGNKITILQNGVGPILENKKMYIATNANILSSFSKEWIDATKASGRFKKVNWNTTRNIEMITLDYLIATYGSPDFIKIDVEGFELEVLKGLSKKFKVLSIEYTVPERNAELQACLDYLNKLSDSACVFNYCITENTSFSLPQWVNYNEICKLVSTDDFLNTRFGDIYVKFDPSL